MQKCNKNVENGVKNIQPVNQSLVLLMPRPSAPSALLFYNERLGHHSETAAQYPNDH